MKKEATKPKPFVKWAGGKAQLIDEVNASLPKNLSQLDDITYVEPFVGGGAVLFWILQAYPNIKKAVINDINEKLICTYRVVRDNVDTLLSDLMQIQEAYNTLDTDGQKLYFLAQREKFNKSKINEVDTAALFIFLNRTCFNGLYRVNAKGEFNVPHGKYVHPKICDVETLKADSAILQKVEILCGDFSKTKKYAGKNSLFYFDPPYKPITKTSSFTSYAKDGFDDAEQVRLRNFCREIATKKSLFIASNSDPIQENFFDDIYRQFTIRRVAATRMINANSNGRGKLSEIMITNVY